MINNEKLSLICAYLSIKHHEEIHQDGKPTRRGNTGITAVAQITLSYLKRFSADFEGIHHSNLNELLPESEPISSEDFKLKHGLAHTDLATYEKLYQRVKHAFVPSIFKIEISATTSRQKRPTRITKQKSDRKLSLEFILN